jgi:histone acetyltransferase (RNA polymerase elongator complex component)
MNQVDVSANELNEILPIMKSLAAREFKNKNEFESAMPMSIKAKYRKVKLIEAYRQLVRAKRLARAPNLEQFLRVKSSRSDSGIISITTIMSGRQFGANQDAIRQGGCPNQCFYCPLERDSAGNITQPRSYLSSEPACQRALQNKHHPLAQVFDRISSLIRQGHISEDQNVHSKVEFIISGGTFNFYDENYVIWYVTSTYYALNVYYDYIITGEFREMLSLEEEQRINETTALRMIGLTIETRPDRLWGEKMITRSSTDSTVQDNNPYAVVQYFRRLGVTRVQIGVQHTDNAVLKYINRGCTNAQNKEGIRILKENGFKVDIHLMLDLPMPAMPSWKVPGVRPEHETLLADLDQELDEPIPDEFRSAVLRDLVMCDNVIEDPDMQVDQWKVYPCETVEFTKIKEWYDEGIYRPYAEFANGRLLEEVIIYLKTRVHRYIRINRVIRDIPSHDIVGGINRPDMRCQIESRMRARGQKCRCIRCREVKGDAYDHTQEPVLNVKKFTSSHGTEYFISFDSPDGNKLYGLCRMRVNPPDPVYADPILKGCAQIRELHVYGIHAGLGDTMSTDSAGHQTQHRGLGRRLLEHAEHIAQSVHSINSMVVIAGVGVKEYYRKHGYSDYHTYLRKQLPITMMPLTMLTSGPSVSSTDICQDFWLGLLLYICLMYLIYRLLPGLVSSHPLA